MPTNVTTFDGVSYAVVYALRGGRLVALGTHQSDPRGVRRWLAAGGHPRTGWELTPAAGTPPGFYARPYLADAYYRFHPPTGAFTPVGESLFDGRRPDDERDGFDGFTAETRRRRAVVRYTAFGILLIGVLAGTFAALNALAGGPVPVAGQTVMLATAAGAGVVGVTALLFGGRGYTEPGLAFVRF